MPWSLWTSPRMRFHQRWQRWRLRPILKQDKKTCNDIQRLETPCMLIWYQKCLSRLKVCTNLYEFVETDDLTQLVSTVNPLRESPIQLDWGSPRKGDRPSVGGKAQGQDCGMVNVRDAFKMGPERWDLCARWNLRGMGIARKKSRNRSITKLVGLHPLVEVAPFSCFERTTCSRILWGSVRCCVLLVFRISVFGKIDDLPCVSTSPLCT